MDPDQTAAIGGPHCGSTLLVCEASNILVGDEKHTFCDYVFKGLINVSSVFLRLGFS